MLFYSICYIGKSYRVSCTGHGIYWQTLIAEVNLTFVIFLLFNNYLCCSGCYNVCLSWFSVGRQMKWGTSEKPNKTASCCQPEAWLFVYLHFGKLHSYGKNWNRTRKRTKSVIRKILLKPLSVSPFKIREVFSAACGEVRMPCGEADLVISTPVISGKSMYLWPSNECPTCDAECFGLWSTGWYRSLACHNFHC